MPFARLEHYLELWQLSDPQPLAETVTSHIYTVTFEDTTAVLKLLTPLGEADEQAGAVALSYFDGHGAVRLLRHDHQAHLLEYVTGDTLTPLVRSGQDDDATGIIAGVLNQLHHKPTQSPPNGLKPLKRWFRSLFKKAETDRLAGAASIYQRAAPVAEALLADPQNVRVLHGDIHHENIRHHPQRGWLAFDPKGLYGERTYDAANTLCNPLDMPDLVENEARILHTAAVLAREMGLEPDRLLAFVYVYACLSASWSLEDGQSPESTLNIAAILEPHIRRTRFASRG